MNQFLVFIIGTTIFLFITFSVLGKGNVITFLKSQNPIKIVTIWAIVNAIASFVASLITRDYSWVDRLWSTLPIGFAFFYVWRSGFKKTVLIPGILVAIWGIRLSLNFARKGGYNKTEDYRWRIIMNFLSNEFLWQLFNIGFICFSQIGLFILFTLPIQRLLQYDDGKINFLYILFTILSLGMVVIETIADQQQWDFQTAKHSPNNSNVDPKYIGDIKRGFLTHGLFAYSRHPNYFGEVGFWWMIWFLAFSKLHGHANSGLIGPVSLSLLFVGSTIFTEAISSGKYPSYKIYQHSVSPIIPFFSLPFPKDF